jgi:signal transduction histidine kinase
VLIVEDDPNMVVALKEVLGAPDRKLVVANSAEDALRVILKSEFAVILLDVRMPGMDGLTAARLIRSRPASRSTPIIFLTGGEEDAITRFRGYAVGAVDYLTKPVVPEVLRAKVAVFVNLHRYNAALGREIERRKVVEADLQRAGERLRALAAHVESVREDERTGLAREVHDQLGQALTGLKMDLAWLDKRLDQMPETEVSAKLKSLFPSVDAVIRSVRRISSALRPAVLDDVGLNSTLRWQAGEFQVQTGIRCILDLPAEEAVFDRTASTAAFRMLQEVLANVARHAAATRVDISLRVGEGEFTLKIADNGRGMPDGELCDRNALGLLGIRERAMRVGGRVDIESKAGEGTTVTISMPLQAPATA